VASHIDRSEVVIYHGGFYSPAKGNFFRKISNSAPKGTGFRFWADINMGGFQMFRRLQIIIPDLHPFKMGPDEFKQYMAKGYRRDHTYLEKLRQLKRNPTFSQFEAVIDLILEYGITIEQEVML
jgi:hypothetical protein